MKKTIHSQAMPKGHGALIYHKSLSAMTPDEALVWVQGVRERLGGKMRRERAYLDRRAARGVHTPTDDAYENDQQLEAELLALLDEIAQGAQGQKHA